MIPKQHLYRYLNGGCLAFAIALKREFGLPIYALVDRCGGREDWPHVFVASEERGLAVDARGVRRLDAASVAEGANVGDDIRVIPASIKAAQWKMDLRPTRREIDEARGLVRRFLSAEIERALAQSAAPDERACRSLPR